MAYIEGGCPLVRSFLSAKAKGRRPLPKCVHYNKDLDHHTCPYVSDGDANWVDQWQAFEGTEVGPLMVHEMRIHSEVLPEGGVSYWGDWRPARTAMGGVRLKGKDGKWKTLRRDPKVLLDANGRWSRVCHDHLTRGIGDRDRVLAEQDLLLSGAEVLTQPREVPTDVIQRWVDRFLKDLEIREELMPDGGFACWGEELLFTLEEKKELIPAFLARMKPKRFKKTREKDGAVHTDPQFGFKPHIRTKAGYRGFCPSYQPQWDEDKVELRPGKWGYYYSYKWGR